MCNSIRNVRVADLYDRQDTNRAQLYESIKQYMEKTLEAYGLHIAGRNAHVTPAQARANILAYLSQATGADLPEG